MNNHTITPRQLFFVIIQTQIGVGILSLPFSIFSKANVDGWLSLLVAGILIQFSLLAIWKLCMNFPQKTIYEMMPIIMGKSLGFLCNIIYTVHFLLISILILILYQSIVSKWILFETPHWVIIFILALTGGYMIRGSARILARFFILVTPLLIILLGLILYSYTDVNLLYILPIGNAGIINIVQGSKDAIVALLGFDTALVFLAYTNGTPNKKLKAISFGSLCVTLFYTFIVFTTYIYFNPKEIIIVSEPVLYMLKAFSFHFIERTDLIFLSLWMVSVATSFASYLFLSLKGVHALFKWNDPKRGTFLIASFCGVIAIIPNTNLEIAAWNKYISLISITFSLIFPSVLLLIAIIRKKTRKTGAVS
jgi:spore germination protein (amino acid permease)